MPDCEGESESESGRQSESESESESEKKKKKKKKKTKAQQQQLSTDERGLASAASLAKALVPAPAAAAAAGGVPQQQGGQAAAAEEAAAVVGAAPAAAAAAGEAQAHRLALVRALEVAACCSIGAMEAVVAARQGYSCHSPAPDLPRRSLAHRVVFGRTDTDVVHFVDANWASITG
jgi:hypothetical protein